MPPAWAGAAMREISTQQAPEILDANGFIPVPESLVEAFDLTSQRLPIFRHSQEFNTVRSIARRALARSRCFAPILVDALINCRDHAPPPQPVIHNLSELVRLRHTHRTGLAHILWRLLGRSRSFGALAWPLPTWPRTRYISIRRFRSAQMRQRNEYVSVGHADQATLRLPASGA